LRCAQFAQVDDHGRDQGWRARFGPVQQAHHRVPVTIHGGAACLQLDFCRFEFAQTTQQQFVLADGTERCGGQDGQGAGRRLERARFAIDAGVAQRDRAERDGVVGAGTHEFLRYLEPHDRPGFAAVREVGQPPRCLGGSGVLVEHRHLDAGRRLDLELQTPRAQGVEQVELFAERVHEVSAPPSSGLLKPLPVPYVDVVMPAPAN
jgi:hypothetical protein